MDIVDESFSGFKLLFKSIQCWGPGFSATAINKFDQSIMESMTKEENWENLEESK